jgi:hypothetical protein
MRFNPPPNWPVGPGWTPDPGFVPDPSWPPVPAGWQFWIDDSPPPAAQSGGGQGAAADPGLASTQALPPHAGSPVPYPGAQEPGPPPTPAPSHTTRNILMGICVAVVVVLAVIMTLFFAFRGSDSNSDNARGSSTTQPGSRTSSSSRPKADADQIRAVIVQLEAAWNASDFDAFMKQTCRAFSGNSSHSESSFTTDRSKNGKVSLKVTSVEVTGSKAVASMDRKYAAEPKGHAAKMDFVKESGAWKMCP